MNIGKQNFCCGFTQQFEVKVGYIKHLLLLYHFRLFQSKYWKQILCIRNKEAHTPTCTVVVQKNGLLGNLYSLSANSLLLSATRAHGCLVFRSPRLQTTLQLRTIKDFHGLFDDKQSFSFWSNTFGGTCHFCCSYILSMFDQPWGREAGLPVELF